MSADMVLAIVGSGGLGAILTAVVSGLFTKKRLSAEATEIITTAAGGLVKRMETRLDAAEKKADAAERRADALEERVDAWRRLLQEHAEWDRRMVAVLRGNGISDIPAPPPLRPEPPT